MESVEALGSGGRIWRLWSLLRLWDLETVELFRFAGV